MNVTINGETQDSAAETLAALVEGLGMKPDRVAVELNREIVPRDQWPQTALRDGDRLEIVHFVGGGSDTPIDIPLICCHPERCEGSASLRKRHARRRFGNPFPNLLT
jgi:thiamine biosynthesis protein ThiS